MILRVLESAITRIFLVRGSVEPTDTWLSISIHTTSALYSPFRLEPSQRVEVDLALHSRTAPLRWQSADRCIPYCPEAYLSFSAHRVEEAAIRSWFNFGLNDPVYIYIRAASPTATSSLRQQLFPGLPNRPSWLRRTKGWGETEKVSKSTRHDPQPNAVTVAHDHFPLCRYCGLILEPSAAAVA